MAEEFNKYLSYVRNLGFEDTPDYDYLRELFTQALKNTGEVEDGEYDWMKLNNGKGWEAMKHHHLSAGLHPANPANNASNRVLVGGGPETPRGTGAGPVSAIRLNAPQPLPPPQTAAKPGVGQKRDRPGAVGAQIQKNRHSLAPGGGLNDITPAASTQAQFTGSTANLPTRMSQANLGMNQVSSNQQAPRIQNTETQPSAFQKLMKALCCGR